MEYSVTVNGANELVVTLTDETVYTRGSLKGETGNAGIDVESVS